MLAYKEEFYHGLLLGMLAFVQDQYTVQSEVEQGKGRSDILLLPKGNQPYIVIEVKRLKEADRHALETEAEKAIAQIHDREYAHALRPCILYGIAFCKKEFVIKSETLRS